MDIVKIISEKVIASGSFVDENTFQTSEIYDQNGDTQELVKIVPKSDVDILNYVVTGTITSLNNNLYLNNDKIILGQVSEGEEVIKITSGKYKDFYSVHGTINCNRGEIYHCEDLIYIDGKFIPNTGEYIRIGDEVIKFDDTMKTMYNFFTTQFVNTHIDQILQVIQRSKLFVKINYGNYKNKYCHKDEVVSLSNGDKVHSSEDFIIIDGVKVGLKTNPSRYGYHLDLVNNEYSLVSDLVYVITNNHGRILTRPNEQFLSSNCTGNLIENVSAAERSGYVFCDQCQDWEPRDWHKPQLAGYHSGRGRENLIGDSIYGIGFEIEKEDKDVKRTINYNQVLTKTKYIVERDGSLNEHGFELISPALPLDHTKSIYEQTDWIENYIKPVEQYLDADYSDRCGG